MAAPVGRFPDAPVSPSSPSPEPESVPDGAGAPGLFTCDECGSGDPGTACGALSPGWIEAEIHRGPRVGVLYRTFCSEEHLRTGMAGPLPVPEPWPPAPPPTLRDRMGAAAFGGLVGVLVGLAGVGLVTVVRFVLTWW
ncbi:hypothetical protein GCM10009716_36090 [Streptomyces sodiiphilus]|uniref:Uncharacterized protein n=1 Tax=Streptomyces sodiiphilus TaxID=226217 RepID=A0ABP5AY12_9ACTN